MSFFYDSSEEWEDFIVNFVKSGLESSERCVYIYDTHSGRQIRTVLKAAGLDYQSAESTGQLHFIHGSKITLKDGYFNLEQNLKRLNESCLEARAQGRQGLRVTMETEWILQGLPGSEKLREFETGLNEFLKPEFRCLFICQYDRVKTDEKIIKSALLTHPEILIRGQKYSNSYYTASDQLPEEKAFESPRSNWFNNIERNAKLEKDFRDSSDKMAQLFEGTSFIMLVTDRSGRCLNVNNAALAFLESSREEVLQSSIKDRLAAGTGASNLPDLAKLSEAATFELNLSINGKIKTLILNLVPVTLAEETVFYGIGRDITRRKSVEQNLKVRDEFVYSLFESIPNPMLICNYDRSISYVNSALAAMTGFSEHELIGIYPPFPYWPADQTAEYEEVLKEAMRDTKTGLHRRFFKKNGEPFDVEIRSTIINDNNGQPRYFLAVWTDITERKKNEDSLKAAEEKYRLVVENVNEAIVVVQDYMLKFFNNKMMEISGYSAEDLSSHHFSHFVHPGDRAMVVSNYTRRITGQNHLPVYEFRLLRADQSVCWVEINAVLITWEGQPASLNFFTDITARKLAQDQLRESEERFRQVAENAGEWIWEVDTEGLYTYSNPIGESVTGYKIDEIVGKKHFYDLFSPETRETGKNMALADFKERRKMHAIVNINIRKDGRRIILETSAVPIVNKAGELIGYRGVDTDITERQLAAEKLEALYNKEKVHRKELQEEAKERSLFIDVLAHELRTPMTPILASSAMLKDMLASQPENLQKKITDNIYNSAQILYKRLEELLDMARYSRGTFKLTPQKVDLKVFLNDVISRFKPGLEQHGQKLEFSIDGNLPVSSIDTSRLEQVILNLLSNASKFSHDTGTIYFKATGDNANLLVEVIDRGIGIAPEDQARLFEPYHRVEQVNRKVPGIGLGLAVSKQIVEAHGGKIWLTSELGKGSTFTFSIPLKQPIQP